MFKERKFKACIENNEICKAYWKVSGGFFYKKGLTSDANTIYITNNYVMAKNTFRSCYQVDGNSMFPFSLFP